MQSANSAADVRQKGNDSYIMEITLIAKKRIVVMRLCGEIDHHSAGVIRNELEREIKRTGAINIALDFGRVAFMDSSGIGMIIGRYKTVKALGGNIIIFDASEQVRRLLKMAGIDKLAVICSTLREGMEIINGRNEIK